MTSTVIFKYTEILFDQFFINDSIILAKGSYQLLRWELYKLLKRRCLSDLELKIVVIKNVKILVSSFREL
jgi:hypothetical protein